MSDPSPTPPPSTDTFRHADATLGVALEVPDGWRVGEAEGLPLVLLAPPEQGYTATVTVSVGVLDPPTPERLQEIIDENKVDRAADLDDFRVDGEQRLVHDDAPGYMLRSSWDMAAVGARISQVSALYAASPERLYQVHASCLAALEDAYLPRFRAVLDSLRFTGSR